MTTDIVAVDGGQEHEMMLGEVETLAWVIENPATGETLSSASYVVTGASVTAIEAYTTATEVGYQITAADVGTAVIEVTLNTSLGNTLKHSLSIDVSIPIERAQTALVVEDGTGADPDANSYATHSELLTYAANRGVDLTRHTVTQLDALMFQAMDYIEAKRNRFQGSKATSTQPLQWPRMDVFIDGMLVESDSMPIELIHAQLSLAVEANTHDLMPSVSTTDKGARIRERVEGVVDVSYAQRELKASPLFRGAEALLNVLYKPRQNFAVRA